MFVDDEPVVRFVACEDESLLSLNVWLNDGDFVVTEEDEDNLLLKILSPRLSQQDTIIDEIPIDREVWVGDVQLEVRTSDVQAVVNTAPATNLPAGRVWSNGSEMDVADFETRARRGCE